MTAPLRPDPIQDFLYRLALQKAEPGLFTLGRAKAKGTGLSWVNPRLSGAYLRAKTGLPDLRGLPLVPTRQPVDDTAVRYMRQWLTGAR